MHFLKIYFVYFRALIELILAHFVVSRCFVANKMSKLFNILYAIFVLKPDFEKMRKV